MSSRLPSFLASFPPVCEEVLLWGPYRVQLFSTPVCFISGPHRWSYEPTAFVPPAPSLKKKQSSHKHPSAALPGNTPETEPLLFEPERPKLPKCPELAKLKHWVSWVGWTWAAGVLDGPVLSVVISSSRTGLLPCSCQASTGSSLPLTPADCQTSPRSSLTRFSSIWRAPPPQPPEKSRHPALLLTALLLCLVFESTSWTAFHQVAEMSRLEGALLEQTLAVFVLKFWEAIKRRSHCPL